MIQYKKDLYHNRIAAILIQAGWSVIDTSWSRGRLLDMIACKPRQRVAWFIEVKTGNKPFTPDESKFIDAHREQCAVIRSVEAAMIFAGTAT
jgi:Holliday junction resolvase-like predicted endonuclease